MIELLKPYVGEAAAPVIFLVLFLFIVGGALWLTPRLARWVDEKYKKNPGYFDGMMEEPAEEGDEGTDSEQGLKL